MQYLTDSLHVVHRNRRSMDPSLKSFTAPLRGKPLLYRLVCVTVEKTRVSQLFVRQRRVVYYLLGITPIRRISSGPNIEYWMLVMLMELFLL